MPRLLRTEHVLMSFCILLCTILAGLQYKWTGEVSRAERDRLLSTLKASLNRLSIDFNGDLETAAPFCNLCHGFFFPVRPDFFSDLRPKPIAP